MLTEDEKGYDEMKILLTTLNSKYIHTGLGIRYLYQYCKDAFDIKIKEYTINQQLDYILSEIYKGEFEVVCFSCYIWNIEETLKVVRDLKKVQPSLKIVLGGPEVSFDARKVLEKEKMVDYIIFGEGEETFKELMEYFHHPDKDLSRIKGIAYRKGEKSIQNEERPLIKDLSKIPSPYTEDLSEYENKIIYYETSRGCPHNCRYCLSSTIRGVRFFPMEQVKKDLKRFLEAKVRQVKFVDRTFNVKREHSLGIMKYISEHDNGVTNFHFEITADLLDEETLQFLSTVREGLFQFEIGVQTTNNETMKSIDRKVDFEILKKVVKRISSYHNIHLHLDLIAGLPYETFSRFLQSFDEVYALKPEKLQLGFLKLLKGSGIRKDEQKYGYIYKDEAPYEVLENQYINFKEILRLKMMEEMVEHFYNTYGFEHSMDYIIKNFYQTPSKFYIELADYWQEKGYHHISHTKEKQYKILLKFYKDKHFKNLEVFKEILKLDYLLQGKKTLPEYFYSIPMNHEKIHEFLHDEDELKLYLPHYEHLPAKKIIKKVHFEHFKYDVIKIMKDPKNQNMEERMITILFDEYVKDRVFSKVKYKQVML